MKVGVTGHQNIGTKETIKWVSAALENALDRYKVSVGYTSLAIGSDQLYAELLKENNIPYVVIVPSKEYETTFNTDDLRKYKNLLNSAQDVFLLDFNKPSENAFYEAGKYVVNLSDIVIAIWDGQKAKGLGGTGDIVEYALAIKKNVIQIDPSTCIVKELFPGNPPI